MEDIVKGSIIGLLIGDALGYPYSGKKVPPQKIKFIIGPDGEEPGVYQGPSSLTLCTMASINECQGIMLDDIVEKFNDFLIAGYLGASEDCSDLSEITIAAIKNYNNGMPPDKCGIREKNDNECLVRMLPVALDCVCDPPEVMIQKAHQVCGITHAETISKVTCAIFCLIVKTLISQKPKKVFDLLGDYYKTQKMDEYFHALQDLKDWRNGDTIVRESAGSKDIADCFWTTWAAYSQFQTDFRLCVASAISLGNDANSTGAVAGSLAGLANGLSEIPPEWLNTIVLSSEAMEVIQSFTDSTIGKINR